MVGLGVTLGLAGTVIVTFRNRKVAANELTSPHEPDQRPMGHDELTTGAQHR